MAENNTIRITSHEMQSRFTTILRNEGFGEEAALRCAMVFTENSIDGIYTHGVNRFARFVQYVRAGFVKPGAVPAMKSAFGGMESWDGLLGPGPLNGLHATERAMHLAQLYGIGCVALSHTNHWLRGGTYGWKAAKAGFVFIGWTNTIANMPAWGASDARLGNNPLVIGLPFKGEAIILDMAMSQYSFGAMELSVMKKEVLPVYGGFDTQGVLTKDPADVLASRRPLPVGYWKGAGLALLLDLLATILSGGLATYEISKQEAEYGLSQVFIAIDSSNLGAQSVITQVVEGIIQDYHQSVCIDPAKKITFPGERVLKTRKNNLADGIPVIKNVWEEISLL